jgi:hypothetical protein
MSERTPLHYYPGSGETVNCHTTRTMSDFATALHFLSEEEKNMLVTYVLNYIKRRNHNLEEKLEGR